MVDEQDARDEAVAAVDDVGRDVLRVWTAACRWCRGRILCATDPFFCAWVSALEDDMAIRSPRAG